MVIGHNVSCRETIRGDILVGDISERLGSETCGLLSERFDVRLRQMPDVKIVHGKVIRNLENQSHDQYPFRLCLSTKDTNCQKVLLDLCEVKIERSCFK